MQSALRGRTNATQLLEAFSAAHFIYPHCQLPDFLGLSSSTACFPQSGLNEAACLLDVNFQSLPLLVGWLHVPGWSDIIAPFNLVSWPAAAAVAALAQARH